jgi:hypothetical protein
MGTAQLDMELAEAEAPQPDPDVLLAALYKSSRPPVDLVPGLPLSPVISAAWLPVDAKARLVQRPSLHATARDPCRHS